jgi:predicted ABC-type sugar transport system permease subunit
MAEKDDGGFYDFLKQLWEFVDDKVKTAVAGAVGAAVGAALGSVIPGIGNLLGALAGWLVGVLVGWIISWFDNPDDIVAVRTFTMTLGAATKSYYDWAKLTTAKGCAGTVSFNGDGGRYRLGYTWRVAK